MRIVFFSQTVVGADKFGNMFVHRVPDDAVDDAEVQDDIAGGSLRLKGDVNYITGKTHKVNKERMIFIVFFSLILFVSSLLVIS
jgi:hypothetical protein